MAGGVQPLLKEGAAPGGWVSFGLLAAILLLSAWMPRFFCRAVCPSGALMGLFARLAPFRIRRGDGRLHGLHLVRHPVPGRRRTAR